MDEACLGNKLGYSKNSSSLYLCIYIYTYLKGISVFLDAFRP